MRGTPEARFWAKVEKTDSCWLWQGAKDRSGYGNFCLPGPRYTKAHRVAWLLETGVFPTGLLVCHHCDTPGCVRPDHLFLGTPLDNNRDCQAKGRRNNTGAWRRRAAKHCLRGHEYTPENTCWRDGRRSCRECRRQRQRLASRRPATITEGAR
jgi:hypothetical protein